MFSCRHLVWCLLHLKKRRTVAPMPLPNAIPVDDDEVAAVLAEFVLVEADDIGIDTADAVLLDAEHHPAPAMAHVLILD